MRQLTILILCLMCATRTVSAETRQLVINSVVVDQASGLSLVSGNYFGTTPTVTMDEHSHLGAQRPRRGCCLIRTPTSVRAAVGACGPQWSIVTTYSRVRTPSR